MNFKKLSNEALCAHWLLACAGLVFIMAIIGAITRLTESGLSITHWSPIMGAIPPLNENAWMHEFNLYRETPEYIHKNAGMTLAEFKLIYFWEWLHRLFGRFIGLAYGLPLAILWLSNRIPENYKKPFLGLLLLGGLQAVMGWWMVKSGLAENPDVSHYRLASHLGLALIILSIMFWMALSLLRLNGTLTAPPIQSTARLRRHGYAALGLVALTITWGAFVAGLDAGLIYNEWPMMGASILPSDMWHLSPAFLNIFENHASVQFTHRWLAALTFIFVVSFAWHTQSKLLGAMVTIQFLLGIATLLSGVHIALGVLHQAGAMLTLYAGLYELNRVVKTASIAK